MSASSQTIVAPGQIWLVEQAASGGLCPLDRAAVTSANVVLYDGALAPLLAEILPLGSYAERLPPAAPVAGSAISPRALAFAADGWSVVQLVEPCAHRRRQLEDAEVALRPLDGRSDEVPVQVIAKTADGAGQRREGGLPTLAALVGGFADDAPLTVVVGPLSHRPPARGGVFTANGLAG